jgi:hypothetical protein
MVTRTHLSVVPSLPQTVGATTGIKVVSDPFFSSMWALGKYVFVRKSPSTFSCTDFPCNDFDALVVLLGP